MADGVALRPDAPVLTDPPWRAVAAMFLFNGALFGAWASRIPVIKERFELDAGALGLLLLALAAGAIVSFPLAGALSDRIGAARLTRAIALVYAPALAAIGLSPDLALLGSAVLLFGAAHGAMDVAMNGWAAEVERSLKRPVMSGFHAMFSLGAGLGAGSGFIAAEMDVGVAVHFLLFAALVAFPALALARVPWTSATSVPGLGQRRPFLAVPRGRLLLIGLVAACVALGEGAMADWSAVFLVTVAAASEATAALGYAVFSITMVATRLLGDRIVHRFGPVATARASGGIALTGVLLATLGADRVSALAGFALMGVGYAVVMPLVFSRAANDPTARPGTAIASVATFGYGGMLLGPPAIGFLAELISLRAAFGLLALLAGVVVTLAFLLRAPGPARR